MLNQFAEHIPFRNIRQRTLDINNAGVPPADINSLFEKSSHAPKIAWASNMCISAHPLLWESVTLKRLRALIMASAFNTCITAHVLIST